MGRLDLTLVHEDDKRTVISGLEYDTGIWLCHFLSRHPEVLSCWTEPNTDARYLREGEVAISKGRLLALEDNTTPE